jgi:enoyl-CoA hydratase/carnithine racemase
MPTMDSLVSYDLADGIATLTMDDGKVNAVSPSMLVALNDALDRAEADDAAVVLAGRPGVFSAGFDLTTLAGRDAAANALAHGGFALVARLFSFPRPVVGACTGHAVALGGLILSACDYRIGASGPFKLIMNEVAIGIALPAPAIELLRGRLHPSALYRASVLAETFTPDDGVATGWLDRVVAPEELLSTARDHARTLTGLDRAAYQATKLRVRQSTLDTMAEHLAGEIVLIQL